MTPEQLKASILQRAIQGQLVEQRPEEGTAEELYQQIQKEKEKLIKEKKIKKEKSLEPINEADIPFDIPSYWKWVKWGEVINVVSARRVHQTDWKPEGIPFYRAREIAELSRTGYVDNELFISEELFEEFSASGVPQPGDIMVTAVGTLGKTYIVKETDKFYYKDASVICFENRFNLSSEYIAMLMQAPLMNQQIKSNSDGTTVATLTMVRMNDYLFPLPPLEEQHRIVAKIEELLPYIDRYEQAWSKLEAFNKRFPVDMQKSLLQMAIQGKLVEQRPEEGTGEDLFRQIQEEKQHLIQEGKIKKQKPLPEISEDEHPFDIPESWKWCHLNSISSKITDGEHKTPRRVSEFCGFYLLSARNVGDGSIQLSNVDYVDSEEYNNISRRCNPQRGDILLSCSGSVGRCAVVSDDNKYVMVRSAAMVSPIILDSQYLMYCIQSSAVQEQIRSKTKQTAQANLFQAAICSLLVPLPPLAEQRRIVAKLEELLPLCERLK